MHNPRHRSSQGRFRALGISGAGALLFLPLAASADITTYQGVLALLTKIEGWLYGGLLVIAVIVIILAAYNFLGSSGDEKKVESAKKQLLYALIAVAVAVLSQTLVSIVQTLITKP